jgi:large subunit ribosomal protein L11
MIKKAAKIQSAAKDQIKNTVATLTKEQAMEIAKKKMVDLNCYDEQAALRSIAGTCKQMGVKIKDVDLCPIQTAKGVKK